MIIGLTGRIASGKGEIVEYLKKKGFEYCTISQLVRELAARLEIPIKRESLQDVGNLIRKYEGNHGLVKRILRRIDLKKNYIIDGIRNPGEIEELRKVKDFYLVSVDAPLKERFQRVLKRNKDSDPKTWEEFVKMDERDFEEKGVDMGQQVGKCMALADFHIVNDSSIEDFHKKIQELFEKILKKER